MGSFSKSVSSDSIREAWSKDLNSDLPVELWEEALSCVHRCSTNSRYRLIQYKVLYHYSKTKLNRIFPSVSSVCDKCQIAEGSLAHLFWSCPKLQNFWSAIFIYQRSIPYTSSLIMSWPSLDARLQLLVSDMTRRPLCA